MAQTWHDQARGGTPPSQGDSALVVALAAGATPTEAAQRAGVSRRTAYRRLEDAEFRRRVTLERDALVHAAVGRLTDASLDAVDTLRALAGDEDAPPAVRVSTCRAILDMGWRFREQAEVIDRLAAIEAALGAEEPAWPSTVA